MVIIEKSEESDVYIFHKGSENEIRLEWKLEEDDFPRHNPPFMLERDILSYVKDIDGILAITKGDDLDIVEKRYRGLNNVLARMLEENEGYILDIEAKCSEMDDYVNYECGRLLGEGGIDSMCSKTLEAVLPPIRNLVDCEWGYVMVYSEVFHVDDWWLKEGEYGLYPGVVVLYELWRLLNEEVEKTYNLFEKIGHKVEDVIPAHVSYRMKKRLERGEAIMQSEYNHPVYTVTGIRYHMGDNLSEDEKTEAAKQFLAGLKMGQKVVLVAEPDNPYDTKAIAAYIDYKCIGYIARENTDEVSALLDNNGQCDGVVERADSHVTLFISIPGAPTESIKKTVRPRQLPESPLGEGIRMPFSNDEKELQLIASRLVKMEVNNQNLREIIRLSSLYINFRKLSVCYDDTLWRDKISKMLYRILYGSRIPFPLLPEGNERKMAELIYELVYRAIGDMRSKKDHWPERVFLEHLERLRNNESVNQHLYKKYCNIFLEGKDFTDADKALVVSEHERLCGWLKGMKWIELRNPKDLKVMGSKVNYLGLSRQELYDLYSVLLLIEKLEMAMNADIAPQSIKIDSGKATQDGMPSAVEDVRIPSGAEAEENEIISKYDHFVKTVKDYHFARCPSVACLSEEQRGQLVRKIVCRSDKYGAYAIAMLCELEYDKWMMDNYTKTYPKLKGLSKKAICEHWMEALGLSNYRAMQGNYNLLRNPNSKEDTNIYHAREFTDIVHKDYLDIKESSKNDK